MKDPRDSYLSTRDRFNDELAARDYVVKKNTPNNARNRRELACIEAALEGLPASSLVLDLPCGSGRLEPMLLDRGFKVVAADYSLPMIEAARAWHASCAPGASRSGESPVFERQDIMNTSYPDDCFDVVICNRLLHHYPESETRRSVLLEMRRICRDRLIVSYYDNFALSALKFHLRNRIRGVRPVDRIPIAARVFRQDYESVGLRCSKRLPVRFGISPQTYLVLTRS